MSVLIVTSLGDIVVDLHTDKCPLTCKNFLKLCKIKYYNGCLFHTVQKDFTAQTGDPTGSGNGGDSIYKFLYGDQARFFMDEIHLDLKHSKTGTIAMAGAGENLNASQFYFTLRDDLDYLDGKHTVFGEVAEGLETLTRINEAFVDGKGRPLKNIRIKHAYILDDPFDDPSQLAEMIPDASPEGKPKDEVDDEVRLEDDWVPLDEQMGPAELEEVIRAKEAHSSAVVLESIGDIPEADAKPPDNVLFVCKLNPVTEDEDLHTIFSRFGTVVAADIIRDFKTGDSLCYAFIEFETKESCEQAYFKMDNALIDDRRIHVDFSQSVSKLWSQYRRKDNQGTKGCFKCGAADHMARDCVGGPTTNQPMKYILKEDNVQRGGGDDSRYDMVFDEDHRPESPAQGKRPQGQEGREDKRKMKRHSPEDHHISKDRRNTERDKFKYRKSREDEEDNYRRQSEKSSSRHREDEGDDGRRYHGGYQEERRNGGRNKDIHKYKGGDGKDDYRDYRKRDGQVVKSRDGREDSGGGDGEYKKKIEDDYREDRRSSKDPKNRSNRDDYSRGGRESYSGRDRDRKHRNDR